jgi:hypothetical protein
MKYYDEAIVKVEQKDEEYYFEAIVMKNLQNKGKIKSKEMFRRERESTFEIIGFVEKKLQAENDKVLKFEEDANDPPIESCQYQLKVDYESIMKILEELKKETNSIHKTGKTPEEINEIIKQPIHSDAKPTQCENG